MAKKTCLHMVLLTVLLFNSSLVVSAELTGQVRLVEGKKALSNVAGVVVYFRSDAARSDSAEQLTKLQTSQYVMGTRKKSFDPKVLAIPAGATVQFPNRDPILHNVFSVSGDNAFDAGLIPKGDGKTHRFSDPGRVRVFCNVHQEMTANILVLDTPHFGYPDRRGRFSLKDLPAGPGTLLVWHERASTSRKVRVGDTEKLVIDLPLIKRQVPTHKNKFGRSYKTRQRRGRY